MTPVPRRWIRAIRNRYFGHRSPVGIRCPAASAGCGRGRRFGAPLRNVAASAARAAPCQKDDHRHDHEHAFHRCATPSSKPLKRANRTICPIERTATWPDTALLEHAISARHASDEASVRPRRAHRAAPPRQRETPPGNTLGGVQSRVRFGRNESFGGRSAELVGWSERGRPRRRSSGRVATGAKGQGRRSTPGAPSPSRSPVLWSRRTSKEAIEQTQRVR